MQAVSNRHEAVIKLLLNSGKVDYDVKGVDLQQNIIVENINLFNLYILYRMGQSGAKKETQFQLSLIVKKINLLKGYAYLLRC